MIMCVLLCYPVSIHMSQLLSTGRPISSFCFFRRLASAVQFPVISRKSIYPIFTKFGMGVYWVNSLHGITFGEDSAVAN